MNAAELVAMGLKVLTDIGEDRTMHGELHDLVQSSGRTEADGVREVIAMLRDAADSAVSAHEGAPDVDMVTIGRLYRFSNALTKALKELT